MEWILGYADIQNACTRKLHRWLHNVMLSWNLSNYRISHYNNSHLIYEKSNVVEEFLLNWVSSMVFPYFHVYLLSRLTIHGNLVMGSCKNLPLRFMISPSQPNSKIEFASKRENQNPCYIRCSQDFHFWPTWLSRYLGRECMNLLILHNSLLTFKSPWLDSSYECISFQNITTSMPSHSFKMNEMPCSIGTLPWH